MIEVKPEYGKSMPPNQILQQLYQMLSATYLFTFFFLFISKQMKKSEWRERLVPALLHSDHGESSQKAQTNVVVPFSPHNGNIQLTVGTVDSG